MRTKEVKFRYGISKFSATVEMGKGDLVLVNDKNIDTLHEAGIEADLYPSTDECRELLRKYNGRVLSSFLKDLYTSRFEDSTEIE